MTTLMLSSAPGQHQHGERQIGLRDRPKTIVATPKPATAAEQRPAGVPQGGAVRQDEGHRRARRSTGAARSQPRPVGPTSEMSRAKTGSRAAAPPSRTANRSSVIVARIRSDFRTNSEPGQERAQRGPLHPLARRQVADRAEQRDHGQAAGDVEARRPTCARVAAMNSPPSAGPITAAICQALVFHVSAAGQESRRGRAAAGSTIARGRLTDCPIPARSRQA